MFTVTELGSEYGGGFAVLSATSLSNFHNKKLDDNSHQALKSEKEKVRTNLP